MSEKNTSNNGSFCGYLLGLEQLSKHVLSTTYSNSENACYLQNDLKICDGQTKFQEQDGPVTRAFCWNSCVYLFATREQV